MDSNNAGIDATRATESEAVQKAKEQAQQDLDVAQQQLAQAQNNLNVARTNFQHLSSVLQDRRNEMQKVVTERDALIWVPAIALSLDPARAQQAVEKAREDVTQAQGQLSVLEAKLHEAEMNVEKAKQRNEGVQKAVEPTPKPTPEPASEPASEPTPEPAAEPVSEPTAEPVPKPAADPTSNPAAEQATEPAAEQATNLEAAQKAVEQAQHEMDAAKQQLVEAQNMTQMGIERVAQLSAVLQDRKNELQKAVDERNALIWVPAIALSLNSAQAQQAVEIAGEDVTRAQGQLSVLEAKLHEAEMNVGKARQKYDDSRVALGRLDGTIH